MYCLVTVLYRNGMPHLIVFYDIVLTGQLCCESSVAITANAIDAIQFYRGQRFLHF